MKFTLEIELGNDAMRTGTDVALALRRLTSKLDEYYFDDGADGGKIIDRNGNTVGKWRVTA